MCPFDYTTVAVSGKIGIPLTGLTTPDRWLSLLQLTVLNRSAIVVLSKILVAFFSVVVALLFGFFCGCRVFCHSTESDIFPFLLLFRSAYPPSLFIGGIIVTPVQDRSGWRKSPYVMVYSLTSLRILLHLSTSTSSLSPLPGIRGLSDMFECTWSKIKVPRNDKKFKTSQ